MTNYAADSRGTSGINCQERLKNRGLNPEGSGWIHTPSKVLEGKALQRTALCRQCWLCRHRELQTKLGSLVFLFTRLIEAADAVNPAAGWAASCVQNAAFRPALVEILAFSHRSYKQMCLDGDAEACCDTVKIMTKCVNTLCRLVFQLLDRQGELRAGCGAEGGAAQNATKRRARVLTLETSVSVEYSAVTDKENCALHNAVAAKPQSRVDTSYGIDSIADELLERAAPAASEMDSLRNSFGATLSDSEESAAVIDSERAHCVGVAASDPLRLTRFAAQLRLGVRSVADGTSRRPESARDASLFGADALQQLAQREVPREMAAASELCPLRAETLQQLERIGAPCGTGTTREARLAEWARYGAAPAVRRRARQRNYAVNEAVEVLLPARDSAVHKELMTLRSECNLSVRALLLLLGAAALLGAQLTAGATFFGLYFGVSVRLMTSRFV